MQQILSELPRSARFVLGALAAFILLLLLRFIFVPGDQGRVSVQSSYNTLARALDAASLLPLRSMIDARAGLSALCGGLQQPSSVSNDEGISEISLGQVIRADIEQELVTLVVLRPADWRDLPAGELRDALRALSRIPLSRQAGKSQQLYTLPSMPASFSFNCVVGVETYEFTPSFSGEDLREISVRLYRPPALP